MVADEDLGPAHPLAALRTDTLMADAGRAAARRPRDAGLRGGAGGVRTVAVLPVKRFGAAKQRLGEELSPGRAAR